MLLPASRKRGVPDTPDDPTDDTPTGPMTKAQKRKLRRIAEEKAARAQRAHALATMQSHALDAHAALLMRSTATRGQRSTVKESLKRDLALQRAGLPLPLGSRLLRQGGAGGEEEDEGGVESEEEELEVCVVVVMDAIALLGGWWRHCVIAWVVGIIALLLGCMELMCPCVCVSHKQQ